MKVQVSSNKENTILSISFFDLESVDGGEKLKYFVNMPPEEAIKIAQLIKSVAEPIARQESIEIVKSDTGR